MQRMKNAKVYFGVAAVIVAAVIYYLQEDYESCIKSAAVSAKTDAGMQHWARLCYETYKEIPRQPRDLFQESGIIPKPDR